MRPPLAAARPPARALVLFLLLPKLPRAARNANAGLLLWHYAQAAFTYVTFIYHPPASSTNKTLGYYDANAPPEFGPMHGI